MNKLHNHFTNHFQLTFFADKGNDFKLNLCDIAKLLWQIIFIFNSALNTLAVLTPNPYCSIYCFNNYKFIKGGSENMINILKCIVTLFASNKNCNLENSWNVLDHLEHICGKTLGNSKVRHAFEHSEHVIWTTLYSEQKQNILAHMTKINETKPNQTRPNKKKLNILYLRF